MKALASTLKIFEKHEKSKMNPPGALLNQNLYGGR